MLPQQPMELDLAAAELTLRPTSPDRLPNPFLWEDCFFERGGGGSSSAVACTIGGITCFCVHV